MKKNNVIVIGASRLGANIATYLTKIGENVLVLDKNKDSFNKLDDFSGFLVCGDATDDSTLVNYGIKNAKSVIIVTDDDNTNLFISLMCEHIYEVPNILIRLNDVDKKKLIENTKIKAIYPFELSLSEFNRMTGDR